MALAFHGFSIRDYTSKMRTVDVFKCWPFAVEGVSRLEAECWLPPMTVSKFGGWSDEFVGLRSNLAGDGGDQGRENRESQAVSGESESEKVDKFVTCGCAGEEEEDQVEEEQEKVEMICPVCRDFNAATLTAVNAHIDGCLVRRVRKERQRLRRLELKAPKKRSIAEIFELKEDVEEEKRPQEIETEIKLLPLDAGEVSSAVTKLRWLSERLQSLRSNGISFESVKSVGANSNSAEEEKSERLRPGCRVFNAATETAVNAHINGCLATAMREEGCRRPSLDNPKPKAPKKRSIADILTVALPIDAYGDGELAAEGEIDDEGEELGEELEKHGFSGERIKSKKCTNNMVRKKKKVEKVIVKKKNKVKKQSALRLNGESKKINKRKKKKKKLNNVFTATKEDACKRKMQNPVHSLRKEGTVGNKKVKLDGIDASSSREKRVSAKIVLLEKKEKLKNRDLVVKQQKAVSPIRGTLKNHKHISGSTSSGSNIQNDTEEIHYDVEVPSLDKHLGFSAEDSVLSPKKRNSFDETVLSLSSDTLASENGEGSANLEERRKDNIAINTEKRKEVSPIVESKQFSNILGQVCVQNILKPCTSQEKSKSLFENPESLSNMIICDNNLHRFDGNTTTLHVSPHGNDSRSFQGGQTSGINTQACESEDFSYAGNFIDHLGGLTFQPKHANTRTYLEPSPSYSASCDEINERPEFQLRTNGNKDNNNNNNNNNGRSFSADMIANSFLLPEWGKGSVRNQCMEQNSYGLPLNSHGELINFGSGGKVGMIQPETSCTFRGSLMAPVNNVFHENSQDYLRIGKRHVVQKTPQDRGNPFPHYSGSWLGVRELQSRKKEDIYLHNSDCCSNLLVQPLDSEVNLLSNPFIEQNQLGKVQNHREYGMISPRGSPGLVSPISSQPTMRLMGKDVPIGRSSKEKQQIFGGVLWAEEESRRRRYSEDASMDDSSLGRCYMRDWATGSKLQRQTENVLQSVKIQSNRALQSTLLMKGPNSEFLNLQSDRIPQYATTSLGTRRNTSTNLRPISQAPTSCSIYTRQQEHLPEQFVSGAKTPGLCFHSQVPSSPHNFHLSTLSNGEQSEEKKRHRVTNSAFGFPFLHPIVEEQAKSSWFKRSYNSFPASSLGSTYQKMPGNSTTTTSFHQNAWRNYSTTTFVNHSDVLYPNSGTSHYRRNAPLSPKSSAHPHSPYASVSTVAKPPSAIDGCRNILRVTDQHPCTNARKRPAANTFDPAIPNKLLNIEVQKNSSASLPQNTRDVELNLQVGARSECVLNEAQNQNPRSHLGFDSSNQDGVVESGPVKLGPGAKHILKPSQNLDNSTPIHSSISIAATSDCGRDLELQGKSTKMYIF